MRDNVDFTVIIMDTYMYINKEKLFAILDKICKIEDYIYEFRENYLKFSSKNFGYTFLIEYKDEDWIQPYDMDVDLCLYTDIIGKNDKIKLQNGLGFIFTLTNKILGFCDSDFMLMFEGEDCCIYRKNGFTLLDPV